MRNSNEDRRSKIGAYNKSSKIAAIEKISREELDAELAAGIASLKSGKTLSADVFDAELAKEFGI